jgi:hypothetical protein
MPSHVEGGGDGCIGEREGSMACWVVGRERTRLKKWEGGDRTHAGQRVSRVESLKKKLEHRLSYLGILIL